MNNQPEDSPFNKYGVPSERIQNRVDVIERIFSRIIGLYPDVTPTEIRALASYANSVIQSTASEKILRLALKMKKEDRGGD
jgi:predicted translin family RNA/ssDNA-binding protein